jgi:hypothetical protein
LQISPYSQDAPLVEGIQEMDIERHTDSPRSRTIIQSIAAHFSWPTRTSQAEAERKLRNAEEKTDEAIRTAPILANKLRMSQCSLQKLHDAATQQAYELDGALKQNRSLQIELNQLKEVNSHLCADNEQLRTYIVEMENGRGPGREENYYIRGFEELRGEIEMWIAKHSKANQLRELPKESQKCILELVAQLPGGHGAISSRYFSEGAYNIGTLYRNRRSCIVLIRHVVALCLFTQVFEPFAFGLPQRFSDELKRLQRSIFSQGTYTTRCTYNENSSVTF